MSKELAPPVMMRHMQHTKDPLPAIGHTPVKAASSTPDSPPKSLDESPTAVVGSLAVARRRARHQQVASGGTSPENQAESLQPPPVRERSPSNDANQHFSHDDELVGGRVKAAHKTCAALLDVLDPDTDGSTIVDLLPPRQSSALPAQQRPNEAPHTAFQRSGFQ